MNTKLRECFGYDAGHHWRLGRAGSFCPIGAELRWTQTGATLALALLGFWVEIHYTKPAEVDEWEAA